jgi:hypothetical protein
MLIAYFHTFIMYSNSNKLSLTILIFYPILSIGNNWFCQGIQLIDGVVLFSTSTADIAFM